MTGRIVVTFKYQALLGIHTASSPKPVIKQENEPNAASLSKSKLPGDCRMPMTPEALSKIELYIFLMPNLYNGGGKGKFLGYLIQLHFIFLKL